MNMFETAMEFYSWLESFADKRVESWFLVASPIPLVVTLLMYMGFICFIGPRFMANR